MAKIIYEVYQVKGESSKMKGKWYGRTKNVDRRSGHVLLHHAVQGWRCSEGGGFQGKPERGGTPHPIPARAGGREQHLQPRIPEEG